MALPNTDNKGFESYKYLPDVRRVLRLTVDTRPTSCAWKLHSLTVLSPGWRRRSGLKSGQLYSPPL